MIVDVLISTIIEFHKHFHILFSGQTSVMSNLELGMVPGVIMIGNF